jgi:HAD superfamily hydrolase (TIGR01509 family)
MLTGYIGRFRSDIVPSPSPAPARLVSGGLQSDEEKAKPSIIRQPQQLDDSMSSSLAAVIFDFDGVVLDSETPEYESHRRIFERCGAPLTPEEWCGHIGVWTEEHHERWHARLRARSPQAPDWPSFAAEQRRLFEELVPPTPMHGIFELLDALIVRGVPTAIASAAPARWVVAAAERLGVRDRFQAIVAGDEVIHRKPAPDVYLEAVRRLGADPARSVAIEDSAPGIASARAAGLKTIAIPHWLTTRHDLAAADLRVGDAGELTVEILERLIA